MILKSKTANANIESLLKVARILVTAISQYLFLTKWAHFRIGRLVDGSP